MTDSLIDGEPTRARGGRSRRLRDRNDAPTVELTLHVHHATAAAILVSDDGDKKGAVWVPLSQTRVERGRLAPREMVGGVHQVEMTEWIATEKGLV